MPQLALHRPYGTSGRARGAPKGRDGAVEAIRVLMVARRSARIERTQAISQARALIVTGPGELRERVAGHTAAQLVTALAAMRPRPGDVPGYATRIALRELGRRAQFPDTQIRHLDEVIIPLVPARAPQPARPARHRRRYRRPAPDRRRGPPPAAAQRPRHPRDLRRKLERAIAYFDTKDPVPPVRGDLQARLEDVIAEQEDRVRLARG